MDSLKKGLRGYNIAKNGIAHIKSPTLLGYYKPNEIRPLVYFKKPKWLSEEDFQVVLASLKLELVIMEEK